MLGLLTVAAASCFSAIESKYALLARQGKTDFCDSRTAVPSAAPAALLAKRAPTLRHRRPRARDQSPLLVETRVDPRVKPEEDGAWVASGARTATQPMNTTPLSLQAATMILQGARCQTDAADLDDHHFRWRSDFRARPFIALPCLRRNAISAYLQVDQASA